MRTPIAIVRHPATTLAERCELTFIERGAISFSRLREQHAAYREALAAAGAEVVALDAIDAMPDSVFVEDTAVVLDECAVVARSGSRSRAKETDAIEPTLAGYRRLERILMPGTLDGGDVLKIERRLYVGLTTRTNREGFERLSRLVAPYGYEAVAVEVRGSLHLKTACTALDAETLLINPAWLDASAFANFDMLPVHIDEPFAANALAIGDARVLNAAFPRTLELAQAHCARAGLRAIAVDISEFGKAEAGLTCMSLVFAA
jgi:dimethylargininase